MAAFGEIVLVALGLVIFVWSVVATYILSKFQPVGLAFLPGMILGAALMWLGIHYGPITVSAGG